MLFFLFRGIFIGLLFGIPVGAVGAMTVQRTLRYGVRAGLLTGLGSSIADCFYACVGAFGLTLISDFLLNCQHMIHCAGGCLIFVMGISLLLKKESKLQTEAETQDFLRMFLSSFAVGITNPAAILTFLLAFSWLGVAGQMGVMEGILLVSGVFLGTYVWWELLTAGTQFLKTRAKSVNLMKLNKIYGAVLIVFGAVIMIGFFIDIRYK